MLEIRLKMQKKGISQCLAPETFAVVVPVPVQFIHCSESDLEELLLNLLSGFLL